MLVITRKLNEKFQIGDDIIVHVVKIHDSDIFLNITLPSGDLKCEVVGQYEEIHITEDVKIRAAEIISKNKVRLGVIASGDMGVRRVLE